MTGSVSVDAFDAVGCHAVAHHLLDDIRMRDLLVGQPSEVGSEGDGDGPSGMPAVESQTASVDGLRREAVDLFEVLLDRARNVERDLAERQYVLRTALSYGAFTTVDYDGGLKSGVGAVIEHDGRTVIVYLHPPVVRDVVLCDVERSSGDRVRVASEFVRIFRDALYLLGLSESIRRDFVSGLRDAVAVLGELVSSAGDDQREGSDDGAEGAEGRSHALVGDHRDIIGQQAVGGCEFERIGQAGVSA